MTHDLREFLLARLDGEEQRIRRMRTLLLSKPWCAWPKDAGGWAISVRNGDDRRDVAQRMEQAVAEYIAAAADPDLVLADLAARRRIAARHCAAPVPPGNDWAQMPTYCQAHAYRTPDGVTTYPIVLKNCPELRDLAASYSWHPDYRTEWRP